MNLNQYPTDWPQIAARIKLQAGQKCERCKHPNDFPSGHVLTVHHLDGNKANCEDWNLAALCQRCHLAIQGRVKMDQLFFGDILSVSDWFKPHLQGFLASKNKLTTLCRIDEKAGLCDQCLKPKVPQRYVGYGDMLCLDCLNEPQPTTKEL